MTILRPIFHPLPGEVWKQIDTHFEALEKIFKIRIYSIPKFLREHGEKWVSILLNLLKIVILNSNFYQLPGRVRSSSDMLLRALSEIFLIRIYSTPKFLA